MDAIGGKLTELNSELIRLNVEISKIRGNIQQLQGQAQGLEIETIKVQGKIDLCEEMKEADKDAV